MTFPFLEVATLALLKPGPPTSEVMSPAMIPASPLLSQAVVPGTPARPPLGGVCSTCVVVFRRRNVGDVRLWL